MESKRKNVIIIIFVITTIIAGVVAVYFAYTNYKDREDFEKQISDLENKIEDLNKKEEVSAPPIENVVEEKNEAKELITSSQEKQKYNEILNKSNVKPIIATMITMRTEGGQISFRQGSFNDEEMIDITANVAYDEDQEEFNNNSRRDTNSSYNAKFIKKEYLNKWCKNIFGKEIDFTALTDVNQNSDEILVYFPTGFGISLYKVKSITLNEKNNEYSMTFDSIYPEDSMISPSAVDYEDNLILNTYVIKYKKENGNNILLSMEEK